MENNQLNSPDKFEGIRQFKDSNFQGNNQINPDFSDLNNGITPDIIKNWFEEARNETEAKQKKEKNPFPIEAFPKPIQEIIIATNESLKFPIDFTGASILFAASVAIGNSYKIKAPEGWISSAVIYIALVGKPGTNKSHPISFTLKPIQKIDSFNYEKYKREKREFDRLSKLNKNQQEKELEKEGRTELIRPFFEQRLISDITPEAIADVHQFNKRGLGLYNDELAAWFHNFGRYNKNGNSEQEFWLSNWSNETLRINRKGSEPILIASPFISVIGGIQPGILNELAKNRTENGFVDRILFAYPETPKKEISEQELDPEIAENWERIVSNILNLEINFDNTNTPQPKELHFTPEAKQILNEWRKNLADEQNKPENEAVRGIYNKFDTYFIRFSLIIQILQHACREDNLDAVGIKAVQSAIKLVEYFKKTALKINSIVLDLNPLETLPINKQDIYKALPDTFETGNGVIIAEKLGMSERTFKRFLDNEKLFRRVAQGKYEKRY